MKSRMAQALARRDAHEVVGRVVGAPATPAPFAATRVMAMLVANVRELPDDAADHPLQNANGEFLFLVGYSALGGPDVLG